ncbi:UNVERIFIED_CONTAM: hypothetical protein GTU68_013058 [Idotea baltica]|nr:hypothetical protein [Idotea baltica]
MNVYDTEKLYRILSNQYKPCDSEEDASLVLVNTCSVRDKPEQKLYSFLGRMKGLKRHKPDLMIGVGGCVAQQEGQNIINKSDTVDFVFGTHNLSLVPSLIEQRKNGSDPQVAINYREEWEDLPLGLSDKSRVSTFVSISRGCNKNCTYCIVPVTRGKEVSRDLNEIIKEAKIAVHRGSKEIVLLGQTVNSYGLDLKPRLKFVDLLSEVSKIPDLKRIRFTSPHPQEIREDFYNLVSENPKVCDHVHMPLQSGSDRILKLMNRNYRRERYLKIIEGLKSKVPDISITTDIIVGFPGETDQDFEDTLEIMKLVGFQASYSFMFSPRPGTKAADMEGQLSQEIKLERLQALQSLQDKITKDKLSTWVNKKVEVLLDGPSQYDKGVLQGRISQNILVNMQKSYLELEPGQLIQAKVTGTSKYTLKADLINIIQ